LSLFALRARDAAQAAALSGMGQSLGYVLAGLGPLVFGALHDLTGDWTVPLLLVTAAIGVQGVLAFGAGRVRYVRGLSDRCGRRRRGPGRRAGRNGGGEARTRWRGRRPEGRRPRHVTPDGPVPAGHPHEERMRGRM